MYVSVVVTRAMELWWGRVLAWKREAIDAFRDDEYDETVLQRQRAMNVAYFSDRTISIQVLNPPFSFWQCQNIPFTFSKHSWIH